MKYKPHKYQEAAIQHILDNPSAGIFMGLGLGKSSVTLTALGMLYYTFEVHKPLIIAPKLVTSHTWSAEIAKWDHTKNLTISRMIGNEKQRIAALNSEADIYAISRDNIAWLVGYLLKQPKKRFPFDAVIIDELSSFKNRASMRFKALKKITPHAKRVIGLTATPAPNSVGDLWSQMYLLDQGERLGKTLTGFRERYLMANFNGFGYVVREGAAEIIYDKISDICISMTAKDYLELPPRLDIVHDVYLKNQKAYDKFKKEETMLLTDGEEVTPLNAGALYNKLLQFSNGFIYRDDKSYEVIDSTKIDEILEAYEALNGDPVIIFYQFKADLDRLLKAIPEAVVPKTDAEINAWNRGEVKCLVAHPASIGHGLNLADGGSNIFWMGLPWSLELYLQAVGRLDRQGQKKTVVNRAFIAKGTVEESVAERLNEKGITQEELIAALKKHVK